ncbi:MAG: hypothetical protein WDN01_22015 [Rhizomicrobium sp.]
MNKRVAKPKRKLPLAPDGDVTDAQIEKFPRDRHDSIAEKLQEARDSIARGDVAPMPPLEELLKDARRFHRSRS